MNMHLQLCNDRKWKHTYRGPGFKAHLLAILVFVIPKIGAASDLAIKIPNSNTEEWYLRSVNHTVDSFRGLLDKMRAQSPGSVTFANLDLDTGNRTLLGDYPLADQTYAQLLERLTSKPGRIISKTVKQNIIEYYAASETKADPGPKINAELDLLKEMRTAARPNRSGSAVSQ
jgi:hypothetical protein